MKKTARVIITSKCDRKCPGCCNSKLDYTSLAKVIGGITTLKDYEEVVITGGEKKQDYSFFRRLSVLRMIFSTLEKRVLIFWIFFLTFS